MRERRDVSPRAWPATVRGGVRHALHPAPEPRRGWSPCGRPAPCTRTSTASLRQARARRGRGPGQCDRPGRGPRRRRPMRPTRGEDRWRRRRPGHERAAGRQGQGKEVKGVFCAR
eukprot:scaffold4558_cov117-Isochrysis_galbana.AAC.1